MEWYFTFQWGVVFQMRGFIFKGGGGGAPWGGAAIFLGGGVRKKLLDGEGWCPPLWETLHSSVEDLCHQL